MIDGYVDCLVDAHGRWDYLGGMLVCQEAGAAVVDAQGRELVSLRHDDRRTPVAAATPELLDELLAARARSICLLTSRRIAGSRSHPGPRLARCRPASTERCCDSSGCCRRGPAGPPSVPSRRPSRWAPSA